MSNRIQDQIALSDPATDGSEDSPSTAPPAGGVTPVAARRAARSKGPGSNGRNGKAAEPAAATVKSGPKRSGGFGRSAVKLSPAIRNVTKTARSAVAATGASDGQDAGGAGDGAAATPAVAGGPAAAVGGALRQHAIPAALVGAAAVWYLLQTKPARAAEARLLGQARRAAGAVGTALSEAGGVAGGVYTQAAGTTRDAIGTAAGSVGHAAEVTAGAVHDGAVSLAGYAKSGAVTAGEALRTGAGVIGEGTRTGYRRTQRAVADTWDQHPLVAGASLLAAGLTAGMFLPAPRQSGALLTRASADLSRKLGSKASELLEKGRAAVGLSAPAAAPQPATTGGQRARRRPTRA